MTPFQDAWSLLKNITDMVEYPEGSGNFMSLRDMLEARNAQSRANLAELNENLKQGYIRKPNVAVTPELMSKYPMPSTARLSSILTHGSGRYDPNNPDAMHPMGSGQ
jgi:hypothetical protein|tara:strand:+ start:539 stop:859 length:321 start_codon:yes stop_codon:yes gene_type:complete